jgi:hypothetical protein
MTGTYIYRGLGGYTQGVARVPGGAGLTGDDQPEAIG